MTVTSRIPPKLQNKLTLVVAASLVGYLVFWWWFPLRPYFHTLPLQDVRSFAPTLLAGVGYGLLLLALFGLYWLAVWLVERGRAVPSLLFLLGTAVLFAIPLLQTYPINANDLFRYVIRGRITSVYGQNPYDTPPDAIANDPFLPLAGEWEDATSPYGPLWELLAGGITAVTQDNLLAGLLTFKLVGLLAHLACGWLIWQMLARAAPTRQRGYTLLWLWNPALLLMFVVDAHNDVLMMVGQLVAIWFWRQKRPSLTLFCLLLAALVKPIGLLVMPFFALALWRDLPEWGARLRVFGWGVVWGGTAVFVSFWPFGSPVDLVQRLLSEASDSPGFSPATLALLVAGNSSMAITPEFVAQVANLFRLLFVMLILGQLWGVWRYGRSPLRATADTLFAYSLQALSFRLWYSTWPFAWLLLDAPDDTPLPYRLRVGLWYLLTTQLSVLIYGHLRVYVLGGSQLAAHLIGIPFVFALPFALARLTNRQGKLSMPQNG